MPGFLSKILPREEGFLTLFVRQAENVAAGATALVELLTTYSDPPAGARRVKDLEHIGDTITHELNTRLNQTFITPFDREDIHELASKVDDVLDLADAAAGRLVLYGVKSIRPGVVELAQILETATREILAAVRLLDKQDHILDHCIEINRLENEGDRICRTLIATLFKEETNPVEIIKWKEVIEAIETAIDKCEDVANVIETVVLKEA
jgi:predicted phosphate transport protein (TIGR00153 family)